MRKHTFLGTLWRALLIGAADIVPGVSGGTMALIAGLYERLTALIAALARLPLTILQEKTLLPVTEIDWRFFSALAIGVAAAFALAAQLLPPLIDRYPGPLYALFAGLILATAALLAKEHATTLLTYATLALGVLIGLLALLFSAQATTTAPLAIATLGIAAGFVMLLPGVSGSYLLLVTGYYPLFLAALATPLTHLELLVPFAAGVVLGIILAALSVHWLLERARNHTLLFLAGLMIGSLVHPSRTILEHTTTVSTMLIAAGTCVLGIILAWTLHQTGPTPRM